MQVTFTIDDAFDRVAERFHSAVPAAVSRPVVDGALEILAKAKASWPVRTGRSKAGLVLQGTVGSRTEVTILDPVGYTLDIHGGDTWRSLVLLPMRALAVRTAAATGKRVVHALKAV